MAITPSVRRSNYGKDHTEIGRVGFSLQTLDVLLKSMNKYSMHNLDLLMKRWEYKNLSTTKVSKMDVSALNELGQDGWEMVAATLKRIYFKRPLN